MSAKVPRVSFRKLPNTSIRGLFPRPTKARYRTSASMQTQRSRNFISEGDILHPRHLAIIPPWGNQLSEGLFSRTLTFVTSPTQKRSC